MDKLKHDIIFISINESNKFDNSNRVYFGNMDLVELVNSYGNLVIIFVMGNYNFKYFVEQLKYSEIDVYGQSNKNNGYYIVVKKDKYKLVSTTH
jgi:hypothetical protein